MRLARRIGRGESTVGSPVPGRNRKPWTPRVWWVPGLLAAMWMMVASVAAETRQFLIEGSPKSLDRSQEPGQVEFRALRPSRVVPDSWTVDVVVRNRGKTPLLPPLVLSFDQQVNVSRDQGITGVNSGGVTFINLSSKLSADGLAPGAELPPFTITMPRGSGVPSVAGALYAKSVELFGPVAVAQSVTTDEDAAVSLVLSGTDADGDALTFTVVTSPSRGVLTGTAPNLTYTPNPNAHGTDRFTFKVNDGRTDSSVAAVTVLVRPVNDVPVAAAQTVAVASGAARSITLAGSDVDGDALSFAVVTPPTQGVLSGTAPNLTYTSNPNATGADSFTFKVNDGRVDSPVATVAIEFGAGNRPPVAIAQTVTADEDIPKAITLAGSDADGNALTHIVVSPPNRGTLSGTAPNLTYTPNPNAHGADSFTFKVNDGTVDSPVTTVSITVRPVNDVPVAAAQTVAVASGAARSITLAGSDVDGDALSFAVVTPPTQGVLSGTAPNLTYTSNPNATGAENFTFKVNDGRVDSPVATVAIEFGAGNRPPVAIAQTVTADEDIPKAITLAGSDADGNALTHIVVSPPNRGTLSGTVPNLTYTPNPNAHGADSFTFKVNDGTVDSPVATVAITVRPVNDAPVAAAQTVAVASGAARSITLAGSDVDGDVLSFVVVTSPTKGVLSGTAPNLTYTSNPNATGADSFTFKVNDGRVDSPVAPVAIGLETPSIPTTVELRAGSVTGAAAGGRVVVPVTVGRFPAVTRLRFSMLWNPSVLEFLAIEDLGLAGLTQSAFDPTSIANGRLGVRWERSGTDGISLGAGSRIFGVAFRVLGTAGTVASVGFDASLGAREVTVTGGSASLDLVDGTVTVVAAPPSEPQEPALAVRTLDVSGLPLDGVISSGVMSGRGGWMTLPVPTNGGWLRFESPGRLPVFRPVPAGNGVREIPSPRLTLRNPTARTLGGLNAVVTPLLEQSLTAPLPPGWTPVSSAVFEFTTEPASPVEETLAMSEAVPADTTLWLARFNPDEGGWSAVHSARADGGTVSRVRIPGSGTYAIVVADSEVGVLQTGSLLPSSPRQVPEAATLEAMGAVTPESRPASLDASQVTATARVVFRSSAGPLPSGVGFRCSVREEYRLRDGSRRVPPVYDTAIVAFRTAASAGAIGDGTIVASFPLRPMYLFSGEELAEAVIRVEVLPNSAFTGGLLTGKGGSVSASGVTLSVGPGALAKSEAVVLKLLQVAEPVGLLPAGLEPVRAFEVSLGGIGLGPAIAVDFGPVAPNRNFVLARAVFDEGRHGFQPVGRFRSDASGRLSSAEPQSGERLSGIDGGGQYWLLQTAAPEAVVAGIARDSAGNPNQGLMVRRGPWTAFTDAEGTFRLLAPVGRSEVSLLDASRGDTGRSEIEVGGSLDSVQTALDAGPQGPRVVALSPLNLATNVPLVIPVELTFNRPVNPVTVVGGGLRLLDAANVPVPASVSLNLAGTVATLLPASPLAPGSGYRIQIAPTVADRTSRPVEGDREFGFVTAAEMTGRGAGGQLAIYQPGATNLTAEVLRKIPAYDPKRDRDGIVVQGSPGTSEPGRPVILVNESTGLTTTTIAEADGSFVSIIRGSVEDFISAVLVNANGTRNQMPATRQLFDDGTIGLFASGGTIRSSGSGVPVDLIVDPGSVAGKTLFKIESIPTNVFGSMVTGKLPEGAGPILGAFEVTESGDALLEAADVSLPVKLVDIGLLPGSEPTNVVFLVVMPMKVDGRLVYHVVDKANYESTGPDGGRVRTASPPFVGMLARKLANLASSAGMSVITTPKISQTTDNPHKGETAAFGILPIVARGPLQVGGFVRSVTLKEDGSESVSNVPGAVVRVLRPEDERESGSTPLVFEGDLVSISDETGAFGFLFRPSAAATTRALIASHPRFPFQRARSGAFSGGGSVTTVVNTELRFVETPANLVAVEGSARPQVSVGHEPALPAAGDGDGATLFVSAVDDRLVSPPVMRIVSVENLRGESLEVSTASLVVDSPSGDLPGRKIRRYRLRLREPGRVVLIAEAADDLGQLDSAQHAVSFGVSRPTTAPGDPDDVSPLRVVFSWPPTGSTNLPALFPAVLRFNRPLPPAILESGGYDWLTFGPSHRLRRVIASPDRREITVLYDGEISGAVRLTVGPGIRGESGRYFDQDLQKEGSQPFDLTFVQSPGIRKEFNGSSGAGVVLQGAYAYALERRGDGGQLRVIDLGNHSEPDLESIRIGYPTAMALVPRHVSASDVDQPCVTTNLLAIFTGHANEPKYLQLAGLVDGNVNLGPRMILSGGGTDAMGRPSVAEGVNRAESLSQVVKAKWSPPYLGYLELGSDITSVKLLNLASFRRVQANEGRLDPQAPLNGIDGLDANGDGDFCDSGDRAPVPGSDVTRPPGLAFSMAPDDRDSRLEDFDFDSGLGLVVGISRSAAQRSLPRLTTMLAALDTNRLDRAFVEFAEGETPRRVLLLPATALETLSGKIVRDLALVTLGNGRDGMLAIVDVSKPATPILVNRFQVPPGEGTPTGLQLRADGRIAVATSISTLILDPAKLLQPPDGPSHRSIVGRVGSMGTGTRDFVSDPSGIQLTHGGGTRRYAQTAPQFTFIRFNTLINPLTVAAQPPAIVEGFLKSSSVVEAADVQLAAAGPAAPTVDPSRHYYVLVDAPGGSADSKGLLPLVLSAIDASGMPQPERGGTVVPSVVGDDQLAGALLNRRVVELLLTVVNLKKSVKSLNEATGLLAKAKAAFGSGKALKKAFAKLATLGSALQLMPDRFEGRRLSDDPDHPLYNRFLAGPFMVLGGAPTVEQLTALRDQAKQLEVDRAYLRASPRLWVGLPSERERGLFLSSLVSSLDTSRLGPFTSQLRLNPKVSIAGIQIPGSTALVEDLARVNGINPIGNLSDFSEKISLIVGVLNNAPVVSLILSGDWKPMLLPGAHGLLRVNHTDRPMLLVPGFAGSKLEVNGENEWLSFAISETARTQWRLQVDSDGVPKIPTDATDALRFAIESPIGDFKSIYADWISNLTGQMGMVEYDYLDGKPDGPTVRKRLRIGDDAHIGQSPPPNLFVFPYDWRLDNQRSAEQLRDYVRLALEMNPDADGVDLVGHSNGGLVARAFMLLPGQRPLVKRFISVGTPWLGAPKILAGLRTGDLNEPEINLFVPIPAVRQMLQFSPGAHQLLPTREYFSLGYRPLVEDGADFNTNGLPNETFTFEGYQDALAKHFLREPAIEAGRALLGPRFADNFRFEDLPGGEHPARTNANRFHSQPIADHRLDTPDVEMHHIVGFGTAPDTIGQIRVRGRLVPQAARTNVTISVARAGSLDTEQVRDGADLLVTPGDGMLAVDPTRQFRLNEEIEVRYVAGDGTVPIGSLARGRGSDLDFNAPHARVYPLIGGFADELTGHNPMLNADAFHELFADIYNGRSVPEVDMVIESPNDMKEGRLESLTVTGRPQAGIAGGIDYVVDFGDGSVEFHPSRFGDTVSVSHRYRQSGKYLVTVAATTQSGASGLTSRQITVANVAPSVTIDGGDFQVNRGETRVLVARVKDDGLDDRHSFTWTLPGGTVAGLRQFAAPVTFDTPGTQVVTVRVVDSDGAETNASVTVTVLDTAPKVAGLNYGEDPARARARARRAPLEAFRGGHPELLVRVSGHATNDQAVVAVSARQFGVLQEILPGQLDVFELFYDLSRNPLGAIGERLSQYSVAARFLGKASKESEFVRLLRELPDEFAGVDVAATKAQVGVRGNDGPLEMEALYLVGGTPTVLRRWKAERVAASDGVRLTFDWTTTNGVLELVRPTSISGTPLSGVVIGQFEATYSALNEQTAADRNGPATVGILNPATDQISILGRDNLTSETNIVLFTVFDANENGRLDDDTFYPLDTNVVTFARLPKRPFAVVGVDEQGNVSALDPFRVTETKNFLGSGSAPGTTPEYVGKLNDIRRTVRAVIREARDSSLIKGRFLLRPTDLWVFEQGSGANLWKTDFLGRCNGIYLPGKSDNDYELFLPVHLSQPYGNTEAERLRFEADGPHELATLTGDWYFRRPVGLDIAGAPSNDDGAIVTWEYAYPPGLEPAGQPTLQVTRRANDDDLASGFRSPFTPAEIIAREFTRTVAKDPARRKLLPDTSFFPERREHFKFGRLHLQRPPEFGDDPIGDGGTGRQMLMLKWLLEGAFVTATDEGGSAEFSPGAPTLAQVFANWQRVGVPRAEGLEWGLFQDFAALKSRPFQVAEVRFGPNSTSQRLRVLQRSIDDAVAQQQASRLKKLGKAAIRATLARLAGDAKLNGIVAGVPATRLTDNSVRSFEHVILELARSSEAAKAAFGEFANDRDDLKAPPDLGDFLRAKNGDRDYLGLIVSEPGLYERFVTTTFRFLREVVQLPTRPAYQDYTQGLRDTGALDEFKQRTENLNLITRGRGAGEPGLLSLNSDRRISQFELPLSVEVYAPEAVGQIMVAASRNAAGDVPANSKSRVARADVPTVPEGEPVAELDGSPDRDVVLGVDSKGRALLTLEGAAKEVTAEQAIVATSGRANEDGGDGQDNSVAAVAGVFDPVLPVPAVSDRPLVFVDVIPAGREDVFPLTDWPAQGIRPRSPRHVLRLSDKLAITVYGQPGEGEYSAQVTTAKDPVARLVRLREFPRTGLYDNSGPADSVQFSNDNNPRDDRLYLRDEELLTVRISGPGLSEEEVFEVMVDLGEFAVASLDHSDRQDSRKPRFDYEKMFLDSPTGLRWASAGVIYFPDDVAKAAFDAGDPVGNNAMRRFLQAFSDPKNPETGEADLLYLHCHGGKNGTLGDHVSDELPGRNQRRSILEPGAHLADLELWNSDAEWLISEACSILNEGLDHQLQPITGIVPGVDSWRRVLRESPKPLHGILGFAYEKTASRSDTVKFLNELQSGRGYVESWKAIWENARLPWAMLYFSANGRDTTREVWPDPLPGDAMVYESFLSRRSFPGGVPEGNCDGEPDCLPGPLELALIQPGLSVHAPLLTQTVPELVSGELPARPAELLRPAGSLARGLLRTEAREHLQMPGTSEPLATPGADDLATARLRAEQFLSEQCGISLSQLRWQDTGEAVRRVIHGDSVSAPEVTARVVRFDLVAAGLPVSGAGVTVNVTSRGVERVGVCRGVLPQESPDGFPSRPLALAEALSLATSHLLSLDGIPQAVTAARLCWKPVPSKPGRQKIERAVPAWELLLAPVDTAGTVTAPSRQVWLNAVTGALLEVTE